MLIYRMRKLILEGCLPVSVNCMHLIAGGSETLVYSPKFGLTKGNLYRVTYDLKATFDNAFLYPQIRFAGPRYDDLANQPLPNTFHQLTGNDIPLSSRQQTPQPFQLQMPKVRDLTSSEFRTGQSVWIANLEIAPFNLGTFGPVTSNLLVQHY